MNNLKELELNELYNLKINKINNLFILLIENPNNNVNDLFNEIHNIHLEIGEKGKPYGYNELSNLHLQKKDSIDIKIEFKFYLLNLNTEKEILLDKIIQSILKINCLYNIDYNNEFNNLYNNFDYYFNKYQNNNQNDIYFDLKNKLILEHNKDFNEQNFEELISLI